VSKSEGVVGRSVMWTLWQPVWQKVCGPITAKRLTAAPVNARRGRCRTPVFTDRLRSTAYAVPSVAIVRAALDCVHDFGLIWDAYVRRAGLSIDV